MLSNVRAALQGVGTIAVVSLNGAIMSGGRFGRAFDDASMAPLIEEAFSVTRLEAVALSINCPGGSAAQSSLIGARIRRLAEEKQVPVYAFCQDVAASGGYWLACAADEIHVDQTSIVGSIGVIAAGFGFHGAMEKLGIERRVHTAGESKSMWDPFQPEDKKDVARLKHLQGTIHDVFKAWVRERRGSRLTENPDLFTGAVWVGQEAIDVGLADSIGHLVPTLKQRFGNKTRFRVIGRKRSFWEKLGAPGVEHLSDEIMTRSQFGRFGL
ncbi:MAG: S49 family peptidase [Pseudomonadota bacterium]